MKSETLCQLYLISPPQIVLDRFAPVLASTLAAAPIAAFQLRLKEAGESELAQAILALKPIAQAADCAFILNDRPDLAQRYDCDGVHVGQQDMPYAQARALVGPERIVGVTCHDSRHLAMVAAEAGADYVAFGAFFATETKNPPSRAGLDLVRWWHEIATVPQVAIGGITPGNCAPIVAAGADFIASSAGVWRHPQGPQAAVAAFDAAFAAAPVAENRTP